MNPRFLIVYLIVFIFTSCTDDQFWQKRFSNAIPTKGVELNLFQFSEKKSKYTYSNSSLAELKILFNTFRIPNATISETLKGLTFYFDYTCNFSDSAKLNYEGSITFFKDRIYLTLYIPESGFTVGLNTTIRIDNILSENEIENLRKNLLKNIEAPEFKEQAQSK